MIPNCRDQAADSRIEPWSPPSFMWREVENDGRIPLVVESNIYK
jgi:hypothetical protein